MGVPTSAIVGQLASSTAVGSITGGTPIRATLTPGGTISILDLKSLKLASTIGPANNIAGAATMATIPLIQQQQQAQPSQPTSASTSSGRQCPECGKSFRNAYKLNRHLFVHKDPSEKPFVCDWTSCTYRSISRNDLSRHKMIHTGEKPYVCEIEGCEKRYSRPDKLRHHKQTVHGSGGGAAGAVIKAEPGDAGAATSAAG